MSHSNVFTSLLFFCLLIIPVTWSCQTTDDQLNWWRGNMHTHTYWSDGDDFPEPVVSWYKNNNYDFLVLTDHNVLLEGERWRRFAKDHQVLVKYRERFGDDWVETQTDDEEGFLQVKLKTFEEFRALFEENGRFMLMTGNEITDQHGVHVLAFHQDKVIPPAGGNSDNRAEMIIEIVKRVDEYRESSGRNTYPVLAHPNFLWAITAEMMLEAENLRFFEVYNGHPSVNNEGDAFRACTGRIWDVVLAMRMGSENGKLIYGLATDDAHNYHTGGATPGRGWVMVRSAVLTEDAILDAIDNGDFYSSTGVTLKEINFDGKKISIEIEPEDGVEYTTEYIGTLSGFLKESSSSVDGSGNEIPNTTATYSEDIGIVMARSDNLRSSYTMTGEELYVRALITSSADHKDQITNEIIGKQRAWVQPVVPVTYR